MAAARTRRDWVLLHDALHYRVAVIAVLISGVMIIIIGLALTCTMGWRIPGGARGPWGVDRSTHGEAASDLETFVGVPVRPLSGPVAAPTVRSRHDARHRRHQSRSNSTGCGQRC